LGTEIIALQPILKYWNPENDGTSIPEAALSVIQRQDQVLEFLTTNELW
jgi:hypothetical protein